MTQRQRVGYLILIMALLSLLSAGTTLALLYYAPFFRASVMAGTAAILLTCPAIWIAMRIMRPLINELQKQTDELERSRSDLNRETERREQVEKTLNENKTRSDRLMAKLPCITYEISEKNGVVSFSGGLESILSDLPRQLLENTQAWQEAVHPQDHANYKRFLELSRHGNIQEIEYRIKDPKGHWRWMRDRSIGRRILGENMITEGIVEDISEYRKFENALKSYEVMVTSSNDFMALIDNDYVYLVANRRYAEMWAASNENIVGRTMAHVMGAKLFDDLKAEFDRALAGDEIRFHTWLETPGFGRLFFDMAYFPVIDRNESVTGVVAVARDMTAMKNMEDQLIQAQKMEAIGTLAGGIAHDFNNILMGIQGQTSLLLQETHADDVSIEYVENIQAQVSNAKDMIRQLLGLARQESVEIQSVDLTELIHQHNCVFGRARKEVQLLSNTAKDLWPVDVNCAQFKQVLLNLYVNAWQAMPDGGRLWVETQNVFLDSTSNQKPNDVQPGRFVKISIRDNGLGMDEDTRRRIFEPFFTTKAKSRGTGLGLASAYTIIRNHGGFITVGSAPGQGTTFDIFLPAARREATGQGALQKPIKASPKKILLVDDEPMLLEVGREMIASLGYEVTTADSSIDAVATYRQNWVEIDLIILDMIMPGSSAAEILTSLKQINPQAKIILTSGYDLDEEAAQIMKIGCQGFMHKPFTMDQLSSQINAGLHAQCVNQA